MNIITMISTLSNFTNTTFLDNRCSRVSNGITLLNGESTFDTCKVSYSNLFAPTANAHTGFLSLTLMSKAILNNVNFTNMTASQAAVLSVYGSSRALLKNVAINSSTAPSVIDSYGALQVRLEGVRFSRNQAANEVNMVRTPLGMYGCYFEKGLGRYIYAEGSTMDMSGCSFVGGDKLNGKGKAILSKDQVNVGISSSIFSGL